MAPPVPHPHAPVEPGAAQRSPGPLPEVTIHPPPARGRREWRLTFAPSEPETPDPLTGWPLSWDTLSQVELRFPDVQSAIAFAEQKGWSYRIVRPAVRRPHPKSYADRFALEAAERRGVQPGPPAPPTEDQGEGDPEGAPDPVDEALLESFPASDPPAWAGIGTVREPRRRDGSDPSEAD